MIYLIIERSHSYTYHQMPIKYVCPDLDMAKLVWYDFILKYNDDDGWGLILAKYDDTAGYADVHTNILKCIDIIEEYVP